MGRARRAEAGKHPQLNNHPCMHTTYLPNPTCPGPLPAAGLLAAVRRMHGIEACECVHEMGGLPCRALSADGMAWRSQLQIAKSVTGYGSGEPAWLYHQHALCRFACMQLAQVTSCFCNWYPMLRTAKIKT